MPKDGIPPDEPANPDDTVPESQPEPQKPNAPEAEEPEPEPEEPEPEPEEPEPMADADSQPKTGAFSVPDAQSYLDLIDIKAARLVEDCAERYTSDFVGGHAIAYMALRQIIMRLGAIRHQVLEWENAELQKTNNPEAQKKIREKATETWNTLAKKATGFGLTTANRLIITCRAHMRMNDVDLWVAEQRAEKGSSFLPPSPNAIITYLKGKTPKEEVEKGKKRTPTAKQAAMIRATNEGLVEERDEYKQKYDAEHEINNTLAEKNAERDRQIAERDQQIADLTAEHEVQLRERDERIAELTAERDRLRAQLNGQEAEPAPEPPTPAAPEPPTPAAPEPPTPASPEPPTPAAAESPAAETDYAEAIAAAKADGWHEISEEDEALIRSFGLPRLKLALGLPADAADSKLNDRMIERGHRKFFGEVSLYRNLSELIGQVQQLPPDPPPGPTPEAAPAPKRGRGSPRKAAKVGA